MLLIIDEYVSDVKETVAALDLDMTTFDCGYSDGLRLLIDQQGGRPLAFILGTRKGDPNCKNQVCLNEFGLLLVLLQNSAGVALSIMW